MAKNPKQQARYHRRKQYSAIGYFVQNFEFLVSIFRGSCSEILRGGRRGVLWSEQRVMLANWNISSLAFHHEHIMARTIVGIWRGLVFEDSQAMVLLSRMTEKANGVVQQIADEIMSEANELIDVRNRLLHATWGIGRWLPEDKFSTLRVEKYRVGKEGLKIRDDLPKSFKELIAQGNKVGRLIDKLGRFLQFYQFEPEKLDQVFSKSGKKWVFAPPTSGAPTAHKPKASRRKSR